MRNEIKKLLESCKAVPVSKPTKPFYTVMTQQFQLPTGEVITRQFVEKKPASVVVPVTTAGNIVLVIQPIALSAEGSLIEIPAGYANDNEHSTQTAIRELVEETGYVSRKIQYLGKHYQDPGSIKEPVYAFVALGCEKIGEQNLDEDEKISTFEVSKDEIKMLMAENAILDANTFIALSKAQMANLI